MRKQREPTMAELLKKCEIHDGQIFTLIQHHFYAEVKQGKITIPKEIIETLHLTEGDMIQIEIDVA